MVLLLISKSQRQVLASVRLKYAPATRGIGRHSVLYDNKSLGGCASFSTAKTDSYARMQQNDVYSYGDWGYPSKIKQGLCSKGFSQLVEGRSTCKMK